MTTGQAHMTPAQARKAMAQARGTQLESDIKKQVRQYLQFRGWFVHHNVQGLGSYHGIPDFTARKGGRTVGVEIKTAKGRQSKHQVQYEADVLAAGCEYIVVRSVEDAMDMDRQRKGT